MPIRLRPIVEGHPPPTGRYFRDHGANYVDVATLASLPTPASPPISRHDGLMRARLCPVHGVDLVPSPTSFPATRRDGLASELPLLGSRGGSHRTTQPHTICRMMLHSLHKEAIAWLCKAVQGNACSPFVKHNWHILPILLIQPYYSYLGAPVLFPRYFSRLFKVLCRVVMVRMFDVTKKKSRNEFGWSAI
jgi:hypothetical protein